MAVLTDLERTTLRQRLANGVTPVIWNKTQVNVASQAIEDWFETNRANLVAAIETAAPSSSR